MVEESGSLDGLQSPLRRESYSQKRLYLDPILKIQMG